MSIITKPSITNFCLLALLALVSSGCMPQAGARPTSPPAGPASGQQGATEQPQPQPSPSAGHEKVLRVWRDYSSSIDEETLGRIASELTAALMQHSEQVVGVEVVRFANGNNSVWAELPKRFIWGAAPHSVEFAPNMDKAPADAKLFKDSMKRYVVEEKRRHEEAQARIMNEYRAHVEEQLKGFRDYLLQAPAVAAPCTRFTTLA